MADTGMELQDMLDMMQDYVVRWKMKFNGKKSKMMVVGKGGKGLKWNKKILMRGVISSGSISVSWCVWFDEKLRGNFHLEEMQ